MPTKIRLQRHGKKKSAFYHIVIADGRAPRDGKFIEKIGTYNPNTNPASIDLDFDRALNWLQQGAQPTDTARAILSYEGVLFMNHLNIGVKKGAMTQDQANSKFEAWKKEKLAKIDGKSQQIAKSMEEATQKRLEAEAEVSKKREQEILAKNSPLADEVPAAEGEAPAQEDAPAAEAEATPATEAEAPTEEATPAVEAETTEAPADQAEAPAEEAATEEAEAPKEEAPAEETKAEETPAEEPAKEEAPAEELPTAAAETNAPEKAEEEKKEGE